MHPDKPRLAIPSWKSTDGLVVNQQQVFPRELSAVAARLISGDDRDQLLLEEEDINPTAAVEDVCQIGFDLPVDTPKSREVLMYKPLRPGEIRLFRLEPRNISGTQVPDRCIVRGILEQHSLVDRPRYNALSYCWGSETNPRPICVNGEIIAVHRNLEAALRELQSYRGDMLLWADRLCINQKDDDEKADQVQQMRNIYTEAALVFAWLGEAAKDSGLIMDHFRMIGEDIFPGSRGMLETEGQLDRVILGHGTSESRRELSNAFRHFCQRSYWQRLWVIQEFGVAQEVVIVCGNRRVSFEQLVTALRFIQRPPTYFEKTGALASTRAPEAIAEMIEKVVQTYSAAAPSFMQGVVARRQRYENVVFRNEDDFFRVIATSLVLEVDYNQPKSTDPRDRIFATLGLANNADAFPMFPDYQHDWRYVYVELAKTLLRQGCIDILSYCQSSEKPPRPLDSEELPSWVPNWNLKIKRPCLGVSWQQYFNTSGTSSDRQKIEFDEEQNRVSLLGVKLDTITSTGSLWDPDWLAPFDMRAALSYMSEVEDLCKRSSHYLITRRPLQEVVGRTCIADRICCEGCMQWWSDKDRYKDGYCQCYTDTISAFEKGCWPTEVMYCRRLKFLHSRRPFITRTGLVGLAPANVEVGDEVCVFFGGKTPYTISKSEDGVSKFRGETYVHGIMYGELFVILDNPEISRFVLS